MSRAETFEGAVTHAAVERDMGGPAWRRVRVWRLNVQLRAADGRVCRFQSPSVSDAAESDWMRWDGGSYVPKIAVGDTLRVRGTIMTRTPLQLNRVRLCAVRETITAPPQSDVYRLLTEDEDIIAGRIAGRLDNAAALGRMRDVQRSVEEIEAVLAVLKVRLEDHMAYLMRG